MPRTKHRDKLWTKPFIIITTITLLIYINHIMMLVTFPFYVAKLGGTETAAGLAAILFAGVAVLSRPFAGWLIDNGKRRAILAAGIVGMALMPMGYMASSFLVLGLLFRMLHGMAMSCASTASSTMATDAVPKSRFGEGMGIFGSSIALATCIAPTFGLALMNQFGFSALFGFATSTMVLAAILFVLLAMPAFQREMKPLHIRHLGAKAAIPASIVIMFFLFCFGAIENFVAKFAATRPDLPSGGVFFILMAAVLLAVRALLGHIIDRKGEALFVYTGNLALFAASLMLAFHPSTFTYLASAALVGYGFGGIQPALQTMAVRSVPPAKRGAANSTFFCVYDIGFGVGGGLAGYLITTFGFSAMFMAMSLSLIISMAVYWAWARHHHSAFRQVLPADRRPKT